MEKLINLENLKKIYLIIFLILRKVVVLALGKITYSILIFTLKMLKLFIYMISSLFN